MSNHLTDGSGLHIHCPDCGAICPLLKEDIWHPDGTRSAQSYAECVNCGREIDSPEIYELDWIRNDT